MAIYVSIEVGKYTAKNMIEKDWCKSLRAEVDCK